MLLTEMFADATFLLSLAWPDRFFPFFFVFSATTKKNGKKRSGHARLLLTQNLIIYKKPLS